MLSQEKEASLPTEPDAGERSGVTLCAVRLPDGTRPARRFRQTDPLRLLFDFVDAKVSSHTVSGVVKDWSGSHVHMCAAPHSTASVPCLCGR